MTKNVNKQNNKRDNLGRTLSNVITSIPLADFQLTNVDVLEQDLENGFNSIHQSLNSGYIHKAFLLNEAFKKKYKPNSKNGKKFSTSDDINGQNYKTPWKLRDNDNETPLELYYNKYFYMNKTLQKYQKNEKLCKLYAFGKNINIELGLGNNNDSLKEIDLQGMIIQDMQINKSRAVLLDDYKRLYILKLKHLGEIVDKQSISHLHNNNKHDIGKYLQEPYPNEQFSKFFISDTHTIAVTVNDQLLTFGDDEYGQCSSTPGSLRNFNKGIVMNVGCSNVSTCVLTSKNELISWGLNTGQFGISELNSKNNSSTLKLSNQGSNMHKVKEINYKNHKSFLSTKPFVYQLPKSNIGEVRQLISLDYATIILHGDNGLLVLTQFREFHFFIPNLGKKDQSFNHFISQRMTGLNKVEKLFVKGEYGSQVVCKFDNGVLGLLDLNDTLNAMSEDVNYIYHDKLKNKEIENMWNKQRFQLPMKIIFKPETLLQKNYVLDIANGDKSLKCGMINFYGDYFYLNTNGTTQGFEQKKYYEALKDADILACDSDCNNFLILQREYDLESKNDDIKYGKVKEKLKPKDITEADYNEGIYNNFYRSQMKRKFDAHYHTDLEILAFDKKPFFKLHSYILSALCPNNVLFDHEDFEVIDSHKIVYKNNDIESMNALKSALLSLYSGKIQDSKGNVHKMLNNIFKLEGHQNLESLIKLNLKEGDVVIKSADEDYYCEREIMTISSKFFESFFKSSETPNVLDFSTFSGMAIECLIESMHLIELDLKMDLQCISIEVLLELLCLSDYLLMDELKKQVEKIILKNYLNSKNIIMVLMTSHLFNSKTLFKKCCEYIYLNIELIFSDEHVISDVKKHFTFKVWSELEKNLNEFMETRKYFNDKQWFNKPDYKTLFKKFTSNIDDWNKSFNTGFTLSSDYNNTHKARTKSMAMSRSSSISSSKFSTNEKPIFKNPFNKSSESVNNKYVSVFNDDDDYSDTASIISKHRKSSFTLRSAELNTNFSKQKVNDDDFISTSTAKKGIKKKPRAVTPEAVQTVKVVPGAVPIKKNSINVSKPLSGSNTKIPVSVIKQGPNLIGKSSKTLDKKPEPAKELSPKAIVKTLPKLPSLNTTKPILNDEKKVTRRKIKAEPKVTNTSTNTNVPIKKQKDGKLYTNLTLDEMISLAKKDKENINKPSNVWFQEKSNLLNKKLSTGLSEAVNTGKDQSANRSAGGVSKWDYTKQSYVNNTGSRKLVSLNELYNSSK